MKILLSTWTFLTRERTLGGSARPMTRARRNKQRGIALITVLIAIAMTLIISNQFGTTTNIDMIAAANYRDQMRSHFLARSASNLSELVIRLQQRIDNVKELRGMVQITDFADQVLLAFCGGEEEVQAAVGFNPSDAKGLGADIGTCGIVGQMTTEDDKININCANGNEATAATLKSAIDETPGAIGAHGLADWIDERGSPISPGTFTSIGRGRLGCSGGKHYPWPPDQPTNFEVLVTHNVLFPPGLLLAEASAFRAAGLFTTQRHLQGVADWEMFQRLVRFGDLQLVDEVILGYRMHDTNISGSSTMAAQMTSVRRSCFYSPENTAEQERLVRDAWRSQQRGDASQRWREGRRHLKSREFRSAVVRVSRLPLVGGRYLWGRPRKRLTRTERRAGFPSAG